MKTREEIMEEFYLRMHTNHETWLEVDASNRAWRDAALAELDDPMAALIAAAPDLLAACEAAVRMKVINNWVTGGEWVCLNCGEMPSESAHDDECWVAIAFAAIKKAKGQ